MTRLCALLVAASLAAASGAQAVTMVGLTISNKLVTFDSGNPGFILSATPVTGMGMMENLLAIDYRPATGQLYGLGSMNRLYMVNPTTGAVTILGGGFAATLSGTAFGLDFNPAVDRVRVVSDMGQNLRLHPDTGALVSADTAIAYAATDVNSTRTPKVGAVAYTNSYAGSTTTTLYAIDVAQAVLVTQGGPLQNPSPNGGQLFTIGSLGVTPLGPVGFDITPSNVAYASITTSATTSSLFKINLGTGAATKIGDIGGGELIRDIAVTLPSGGGNVWFLPSSARIAGLGGSFYTTDLTVTNTSSTEVGYSLKFLGNNADGRGGAERVLSLGAGKSVTTNDILGTTFGVTSGYGSLRIVADSSAFVVAGQTSTPGGGGTVGQSVPAARASDLIRQGSPQVVPAVRQDSAARTNLILANATEAALDVDVSLVGDDGSLLAAKKYTLAPLAMTQVTAVARDMGVTTDLVSARLVLSTATANGAFAAYGAMIDNVTGDPRTLLPRETAKSLFERLGGAAAIGAVIDDFLGRVVADARINAFFADTVKDPARVANLRQRLIELVAQSSGGPLKYGGRDMKSTHRGLGIDTSQFNALVEDLVAAMVKLGVPGREVNEVVALLAPLKGDIVER